MTHDRALTAVTRPSAALSRLVRAWFGGTDRTATATLVLLALPVLLVAATWSLAASTEYGFDLPAAFDGVVSQLPVTLWPAVATLAATGLNIAAGAVVMRALVGRAESGPAGALLSGFVGAVLLDAACLYLLGGASLFTAPVLLGVEAAILAAALAAAVRTRALRGAPLRIRRLRLPRNVPLAWWPAVAIVWSAPLILQLASPVVPFSDVLPNHVAPVEHLRAYGSFDVLTIVPSPIYGPSRLFLGYVGLLGNLSVATGLHATLAVAAFALPETILVGVAAGRLARTFFGPRAAFWVLLSFPLTYAFMRLPDARATVVVLPLAAWSLVLAARLARTPVADETGKQAARSSARTARREAVALGAALSATILVHPAIGAVCLATVALAALFRPLRLAPAAIAGCAAASIAAVPQLVTMTSTPLAPWTGAVALVAALAACVGLAAIRWPERLLVITSRFALAALGPGLLGGLIVFTLPAAIAAGRLVVTFPLLAAATAGVAATAAVGPALRREPVRHDTAFLLIGSGLLVGVALETIVSILPAGPVLFDSLAFEVPKTLGYSAPLLLAVGAAAALGEGFRRDVGPVARGVGLAVVLVLATLPQLRIPLSPLALVEHPYAETLAASLHAAQTGYWTDYADARWVVDPDGRAVIDRLRAEQAAGRLGPHATVLHISATFQEWRSIPIGVFTGAMETSISMDPEVSIHTAGGRLLGFDRLETELTTASYVVYEPDWLGRDYSPVIEAAGFRPIYSNSEATIYVRR